MEKVDLTQAVVLGIMQQTDTLALLPLVKRQVF